MAPPSEGQEKDITQEKGELNSSDFSPPPEKPRGWKDPQQEWYDRIRG